MRVWLACIALWALSCGGGPDDYPALCDRGCKKLESACGVTYSRCSGACARNAAAGYGCMTDLLDNGPPDGLECAATSGCVAGIYQE